jgi:ABC-type multidrug transport system permease subunit
VGFEMNGSWLTFFAFLMLGAICLITMSLIIAARISSEELAEGLLNLMTWPMMLLSGVWFSLEGASPWVKTLSKAMPLTYLVDGARAILFDGAGFAQLWPEIAVLGIMSVVFLAIGAWIFRWE